MGHFGDSEAGFSVEHDPITRTVRVDGWGFWSPEVAVEFGDAVIEACRNTPDARDMVMNMARLKPLRDEGLDAVGRVLSAAVRLGVSLKSVVTGSHITKLQLLRLVKSCQPNSRVDFRSAPAG